MLNLVNCVISQFNIKYSRYYLEITVTIVTISLSIYTIDRFILSRTIKYDNKSNENNLSTNINKRTRVNKFIFISTKKLTNQLFTSQIFDIFNVKVSH